jgi:hypothetical protein
MLSRSSMGHSKESLTGARRREGATLGSRAMATLTTCPKCGGLVSSRVSSCWNCRIKRFAWFLLGVVAAVIWMVVFVIYFG